MVNLKVYNLNIKSQLNENYRFDNFIKDNTNQDALSAAIFVSCNPGEKLFNPLLIYGGSSLGRTIWHTPSAMKLKNDFPKKMSSMLLTNFFVNNVSTQLRTII